MSELNARTKRQIALLAGGDLEVDELDEALHLIKTCPHCQDHWRHVRGSLDLLDRFGTSDPSPTEELWPSVEDRLRASLAASRPRKFNGWVPALSMAAACIFILAAGQMDVTWQQEGSWPAHSESFSRIHQNHNFYLPHGNKARAATPVSLFPVDHAQVEWKTPANRGNSLNTADIEGWIGKLTPPQP